METRWKYQPFIGNEFPDVYSLETRNRSFIEIKANLFKGMVKINITSPLRERYQSVISNGVVIDERDLRTKRSKYLEKFFKRYHIDIGSLPNTRVLDIIGHNYGVLAAPFYDHLLNIQLPKPPGWKLFLRRLLAIPKEIKKIFKLSFQAIFTRPCRSDIVETMLIGCFGVGTYMYNFDYLFGGIFTSTLAILTGFWDWFFKKKNPYVIKIITACGLGLSGVYIGFFYQ